MLRKNENYVTQKQNLCYIKTKIMNKTQSNSELLNTYSNILVIDQNISSKETISILETKGC